MFLVSLDGEQQYIVDCEESTVCIAGPGAGKTRVLTEKARELFKQGKNILCICFTRSAAREMGSRVLGLPATTIHSYCCGYVGWNESWGYEGLLWRFLKETDKPKFDWVLLDECQDVNEMELDVVRSLVKDRIFAVGDPYQSIYGFQGAMGPNVVSFLKRCGCSVVPLHNNYRSTQDIVDFLNTIYNRDLVSKDVRTTGLTAILCRTNDDVMWVSGWLKEKGIPHRLRLSVEYGKDRRETDILGESSLRIMTIHVSKGLEFDKVILFGWKPQRGNVEEKRVYYVAASRASQEFVEVDNFKELEKELGYHGKPLSVPQTGTSPSDMLQRG